MVWLFINKKIKMKNLNIKKYLNLLKKNWHHWTLTYLALSISLVLAEVRIKDESSVTQTNIFMTDQTMEGSVSPLLIYCNSITSFFQIR